MQALVHTNLTWQARGTRVKNSVPGPEAVRQAWNLLRELLAVLTAKDSDPISLTCPGGCGWLSPTFHQFNCHLEAYTPKNDQVDAILI